MNSNLAVNAVAAYLDAHEQERLDRLHELLAIPSVSTDPKRKADVAAAAAWVAASLTQAGLDTKIHPTAGHPIVLATTPDALLSASAAGSTRVLFYGHFDVQPPEPLHLWTTPAFEPTVRDGAIYARGASDDKGQVLCFLEALRAWRTGSPDGLFPVHVTVLIEGEEEIGSPNLEAFLKTEKENLNADVVIISDTMMWNTTTPAITYGLRGLLYFDLKLHNASRDLHSGVYGGVLANPATMLVKVMGQLFDENHRVTIPHFYDDVATPTDEERKQWGRLNFDEMADCLTPVGVKKPFGEAGFDTLQRRWTRPAVDINGLYGGFGGEGAKTVLPSFAGVKVSFRLAANQDPATISGLFRDWLATHDVGGCRWEITEFGRAAPVAVATDSPSIAAAQRALKATFGTEPVLVREGATIPVVSEFKQILGLESVLIGFGLNDDQIHAPNEKFDLKNFHAGCHAHARLLAELAQG